MNIRAATENDLNEIKKIESDAFSLYLNTNFNRIIQNIKINFDICNGGVFVAEIHSKIVGFIYSRNLGNIGWIGTFGVKNNMQGKGVGGALIQKAIKYLEECKCEVIGLETLNSAFKNVEIYLKHGFKAITPSFQLTRKTIVNENCNYDVNYNENDIKSLSGKVLNGYNPTKLYRSASENKWGDVIELKVNNNLFGIALLEYLPKLENEKSDTLIVNSILIEKNDEFLISETIKIIHSYSFNNGYENIDIFLNSKNDKMLKMLIENGFKIKNSRIRMLYKGKYEPQGIECSRWIM